jgi:hypothetical protein
VGKVKTVLKSPATGTHEPGIDQTAIREPEGGRADALINLLDGSRTFVEGPFRAPG